MLSFKDLFLKITEDFKTVTQKFIAANIPTDDVTTYISKFKTLSKNQRLTGLEKNIDTWRNKSFDEFKKFIDDIESKVTKSGQKKNSGTSVDITTPEQKAAGWNIIIPTNKEASCYHGTGTDWCVSSRSENHFTHYFINNDITLIFCLNDKKEKWAIACNSRLKEESEFFNANDNSITKTKFNSQTKLNADEIITLALDHEQVTVDRKTGQENSIEYRIKHTTHPDPELEKKIIDSKDAYNYAYHVLKGPFKAGEEAISKDAEYAYYYAHYVLKGPFKAGEPVISKDAVYAYYYAYNVLNGPFKAGEPVISKNAMLAYNYAYYVLKGPFKAGEEAISKDDQWAYDYADEVLIDNNPSTWAARYNKTHK